MNDRTLTLLFRRYRERADGRALAAVFDATSRPLLDLACHLVRDADEAEDLVQATFLAAIHRAERYDESAPLQAWLYGILWREAAKARRRAARRVDPRRLHEREEPDPLDVLDRAEIPAAVAQALAGLPKGQREVLESLLYDGKRAEHIARELARSPGTVRSQIHRGLEQLRRTLAPRLASFPALAVLSRRGLGEVRAEVLRAAGFSPATVAAAPLVTLGLALGGALVSKSAVLGVATVALALTGTWFALERSSQAARGTGESPAPALTAVADPAPLSAAAPSTEVDRAERDAVRSAGSSARAAEATQPSLEERVRYWLVRFGEAPDDWRHGLSVAAEIAELPPDEALAILTAVWPKLSVPAKEQVLKPFVFDGGKPNALKFLHLAATDATLSVQARAFTYLKSYAFQDFSLDYDAYLHWAAVYGEQPIATVLDANARRLVADLLALSPPALAQRMRELEHLDLRAGAPAGVDLAAVIRAAGGLRVLETCLAVPDPEVQVRALRWSKTIEADEGWLRAWVVPEIEHGSALDARTLEACFDALARRDCGWASDTLLAYLTHLDPGPEGRVGAASSAATALAEIGDLRAIPSLIELLLHDPSGRLNYDVGYFGLAKLAGVTWQESYDGAWWLGWWEKNRQRLPPEVAALTIRR